MAQRAKETSLSAKISSFINTAPDYGEEEDDFTKVSELPSNELHSDSGDELNLAQFRKINIELLDAEDKKYAGVRTNRKTINKENAFGCDSSDDSDKDIDTGSVKSFAEEEAAGGSNECLDDEEDDSDVASSDEESVSAGGEDDEDSSNCSLTDDEESPKLKRKRKLEDDLKHISQLNSKVASDIEKGHAIRNQFNIWDSLLECRIKFQKCLTVANKLPITSKLNEFVEVGGEDFSKAQTSCQKSIKKVLNVLLDLQKTCLNMNTKHYQNSSKRSLDDDDDDDEITSDSDGNDTLDNEGYHNDKKRRKFENVSSEIADLHEAFIPFRNETIQKWNDKTRITQMKSKDFSAFEQSTLKQIETILADKNRLLKRTRTKRSNYRILGELEDDPPNKVMKLEECVEIFDDDDFYHQLLRELLERKTSDVTDPVQLSRQWIQLQKERSKMKKNVDTKASKGRKIRYDVHQKMVNFMMPIDNTTWTDDARAELIASLFGKKAI